MEKVINGMKISDKSDFNCEICVSAKQPNSRDREPDVGPPNYLNLYILIFKAQLIQLLRTTSNMPLFSLMIILAVRSHTSLMRNQMLPVLLRNF